MPYYFNLPNITSLTTHQQAAVDETEPLALSGGPGTGKSVVSLWRHIRNHQLGIANSLLLTYTKTLEHYLREAAKRHSIVAANHTDRTYYWLTHNKSKYDEIIVDEGQDVSIENYRVLKNYADEVSYGADAAQSLYEHGCSPTELGQLFPSNEEYTLYRNFRNSKEILEFTRSVFSEVFIPQDTINNAKSSSVKPIMKITNWDSDKEMAIIVDIIDDYASDTHNIGILLPSQKKVDEYYANLNDQLNQKCSKYHNGMSSFHSLSSVHVTTFKSSKGTEFDTVIIPNFDSFNWNINNLDIITDKDYYVALTRTKTNLFLICKNEPNSRNKLNKIDKSTYDIER